MTQRIEAGTIALSRRESGRVARWEGAAVPFSRTNRYVARARGLDSLPVTVSIESTLPPEVVADRLQRSIDECRPLVAAKSRPFVPSLRGTVSPSLALFVDFRTDRGSRWRAMPVATGSIEASHDGSVVNVTIALNAKGVTTLRTFFVVLIVASLCVGVWGAWATATGGGPYSPVGSIVVPAAAIIVTSLILWLNAKAVRHDAALLLDAIRDAAG